MTVATGELRPIIDEVLGAWKRAVGAHEPDEAARVFTSDALFQGLRPDYSIGREGVRAYYDSQPLGMTADYEVLEARALTSTLALVYAKLRFGFVDGHVNLVHLTAMLEQESGEWRIGHYHVSRIA